MKMFKSTSLSVLVVGAIMASPMSAYADEVPVLEIENFIGKITWKTGERLSAKITDNKKDVTFYEDADLLKIDGGIEDVNDANCRGYSGKYEFDIGIRKSGWFGGYKDLDEFPTLEITMPENTAVKIENAIPFIMGDPDVSSLSIRTNGCSDITVGDVRDFIDLQSKGSGDLTAGDTPKADISIRGSGDVELDSVGQLDLSLTGSGDVDIETLGSGDISLRGSGDIEIGDVSADIELSSAGSGDITLGNVAGKLVYGGSGSGDFYAKSANQYVSVKISGSGDAEIDGGEAEELVMTATGSSNATYGGTAVNAKLRASGSSDIEVYRVTGSASQSETGSADVKIRKQN